MADQKRATFITKLAARTADGSVRWEATSEENVFQAAFPNHVVLIFTKANERHPDLEDLVIQINDDTGRKLERLTDDDFENFTFGNNTVARLMWDLYSDVRNRALGLDKAVDALLEELEDLDTDNLPF